MLAPPSVVHAHHEAIFGPQSGLMLSSNAYVSTQIFSRRLGTPRGQDFTGVVAGGISPFHGIPLSFSGLLPVSYSPAHSHGPTEADTHFGLEDAVLGLRYRFDLTALQESFGREGNFVLGMAGLDLPTGTLDHPAFKGPLDYLGAGLGSLESGAFSGLGYAFLRHNGIDGSRSKEGNVLLIGTGVAWTPIDNEDNLLSLQLGGSYERYFRHIDLGVEMSGTGGEAFLLHPTVIWSPWHHGLVFAMVSVPLKDGRPASESEAFRAGLGLIHSFGH
jgi:hypothetical protein